MDRLHVRSVLYMFQSEVYIKCKPTSVFPGTSLNKVTYFIIYLEHDIFQSRLFYSYFYKFKMTVVHFATKSVAFYIIRRFIAKDGIG
jgi:hypothetical protein